MASSASGALGCGVLWCGVLVFGAGYDEQRRAGQGRVGHISIVLRRALRNQQTVTFSRSFCVSVDCQFNRRTISARGRRKGEWGKRVDE